MQGFTIVRTDSMPSIMEQKLDVTLRNISQRVVGANYYMQYKGELTVDDNGLISTNMVLNVYEEFDFDLKDILVSIYDETEFNIYFQVVCQE